MFLKVLVIIIVRFGENNVFGPKYIDMYINFGGAWSHGFPYIFRLLFIKTINSTSFRLFFIGLIIKKLRKGGAFGARLRFF